VEVYGTFLEEHASCIIMELLQGQSLGHMLRAETESQTLSLPRIKHLLSQVTTALAFAHARSIVHRDVKPDNIMVLAEDVVKVTDFGIARIVRPGGGKTTMPSTGLTMGTPYYMAPDQIEGRRIDGRADVYSLGAVLYQLVTGRPPFEGDDPLTIAFKHVHQTPQPPSEIKADLPADWEALILKALAKDPAERFQTALTMGEAIAALSTPDSGAAVSQVPDEVTGPPVAVATLDASELAETSTASQSATPSEAAAMDGRAPSVIDTADAPSVHPPRRPLALPALPRATVLGGIVLVMVAVLALGVGVYLANSSGTSSPQRASLGRAVPEWGHTIAYAGPFSGPQGVAVDAQGNIYVVDTGNNRVQKMSLHGELLATWGTHGTGRGQLSFPGKVAIDRRGNIYVTDAGNARIEELSPSGRPIADLLPPGYPSFPSAPSGVTVDPSGNVIEADLFGMRRLPRGGTGFRDFGHLFCQAGACTDLASDSRGIYLGEGSGNVAWLSLSGRRLGSFPLRDSGPGLAQATGIALDHQGNLYVMDTANHLLKLTPGGARLELWGASGSGPGQFNGARQVAVDTQGRIYVADTSNNRIQVLSPTGRFLTQLGVPQAHPKQFGAPNGVAVDERGNVYVADTGHDRIQELSSAGRLLGQWGTFGSGLGQFKAPYGVTVDTHSRIYVADTLNNRIQVLAPGGKPLLQWGTIGTDPGKFDTPEGIAVDSKGDIYVADTGNTRVQKFTATGKLLESWDLTNHKSKASFFSVSGVAVDGSGNIYVADADGSSIQKLSPTGQFLIQWGSPDGHTPGELNAPTGVAADGQGTIYVADTGHNRIAVFSSSGKLLASGGSAGSSPGQFSQPQGVAVDAHGNVYVADTGNSRIQKFVPAR
jgi:DNA-binding beta-propeller fold protein YncE